MATMLTVLLTDNNANPDPAHNATLVLSSADNSWLSQSAVLVSAGGGVTASNAPVQLVCGDEGATIVTLKGASWDSAQGDSGDADCGGCKGSIQKYWSVTNRA